MPMQWLNELVAWWSALPRDMVFLFSLPFLVAAVGLLAHETQRPGRREANHAASSADQHRHA